jgi:hypothetical protein
MLIFGDQIFSGLQKEKRAGDQMVEIHITPTNPFDFSSEELEGLAESLRSEDSAALIHVRTRPEHGYGVSPYEVVELVATAGGAAAAVDQTVAIFRRAVNWTRERWQRERSEKPDESPRPRTVRLVYGPDGDVLKSVTIDLPDGEPQEDLNPTDHEMDGKV